jgi:cell division protein FtsQ
VQYLGKNVYFDKDGIVVESSEAVMDGVPMISGLSFQQLTMYQALDVQDPDIFNTILTITQLLKKYDLNPDEIRFAGSDELYLQMGEVKVALGTGENLDEKVARLKQLEDDLSDKSGTLHMESYTDESTHISLEASK